MCWGSLPTALSGLNFRHHPVCRGKVQLAPGGNILPRLTANTLIVMCITRRIKNGRQCQVTNKRHRPGRRSQYDLFAGKLHHLSRIVEGVSWPPRSAWVPPHLMRRNLFIHPPQHETARGVRRSGMVAVSSKFSSSFRLLSLPHISASQAWLEHLLLSMFEVHIYGSYRAVYL